MELIKKKYRVTITNSLAIISIGSALYYFANPDTAGWRNLAGLILIVFGIISFGIDFILQWFIKNYWLLTLVEIILLVSAYTLYVL